MLKYELFKNQLEIVIQNSNLDLGAVLFILKDMLHTVEKMYNTQIQKELQEQNKKEVGD